MLVDAVTVIPLRRNAISKSFFGKAKYCSETVGKLGRRQTKVGSVILTGNYPAKVSLVPNTSQRD